MAVDSSYFDLRSVVFNNEVDVSILVASEDRTMTPVVALDRARKVKIDLAACRAGPTADRSRERVNRFSQFLL